MFGGDYLFSLAHTSQWLLMCMLHHHSLGDSCRSQFTDLVSCYLEVEAKQLNVLLHHY